MNLSEPVDTGAMSIPDNLKYLGDELLVMRAKAGDTLAFVQLRERHSTKDRQAVRELCQVVCGFRLAMKVLSRTQEPMPNRGRNVHK
jgi:hypothetical protein